QKFQKLRRQRDVTRNPALTCPNVNDHPLTIDVWHLERVDFGAAQSRSVERRENRAMFQVHRGVESLRDVLLTQHLRQFPSNLWFGNLQIEPRPLAKFWCR